MFIQDGATWTQAKPIKYGFHPHAFVAYRDGAIFIFMTSELAINESPYYAEGKEGTSLLFIAPDGTASDPKLGVHTYFQAWGAAGDGDSLALLGTIAVKAKSPKPDEPNFDEMGVHLLRLDRNGVQKTSALQRARTPDYNLGPYQLEIHPHGTKTVVVPPRDIEGLTKWQPNIRTVSIVDETGKVALRTVAGDETCLLHDAELAGDVVYALRHCLGGEGIYPDLGTRRRERHDDAREAPAAASKAPHPVTRVTDFGTRSCVGCHHFAFPGAETRGESGRMQKTALEHAVSGFADKTCASCHMRNSHAFKASRDGDLLAAALEVKTARTADGDAEFFLSSKDVGMRFRRATCSGASSCGS